MVELGWNVAILPVEVVMAVAFVDRLSAGVFCVRCYVCF
jgi:hypothetical protein